VVTGTVALARDAKLGLVGLGGAFLGPPFGLFRLTLEALRLGCPFGRFLAAGLARLGQGSGFRGVGLRLVSVRRGAFGEPFALETFPFPSTA
jgi:hypothetical protein